MDIRIEWSVFLIFYIQVAIVIAILLLIEYNLFYKKIIRRIEQISKDIVELKENPNRKTQMPQ
jgi:hypothetical protein